MLAQVPSARQLAPLPNGDLLVSSQNDTLYIVPAAEAPGASGAPLVFAQLPEKPAQGLVFVAATCTIYVATSHDIYAIPYADGQKSAAVGSSIAKVRQGGIPQNSDGDVHTTTSLAFANGVLYAGVGSSCNACNEVDGTRATIQRFAPDGSNQTTKARRFRNAIAMAINPATGTLWAGGAGQDSLPLGHPYEFFDAVTLHDGIADYGWPDCEENHLDYGSGADCSKTVAPLVELPAYSTIIGATFYPAGQTGAHAFPAKYQGSLFVTAHGSWHTTGSGYFSAPRIAFVEMNGDAPKIPVDWNDPTKQWTDFGGGFQLGDGSTRIARPSGIAVGHDGSLFVADDHNGNVYRIRPK
jgi:glucose/arabinose dehydrogenase